MRKYLAIAKATWQEYLAYRANFFLEMIGGFLARLVLVALWFSIFASLPADGSQMISGFTRNEMITYIIGVGIINSFIWLIAQGDEINNDIIYGHLSNYLVKPMSIPLYWLTRDLCRRLLTLLMGIGQYILLVIVFVKYMQLPSSPRSLFFAFVFSLLAGILHFLSFSLLSFAAFWMEQTWSTRFVLRVAIGFASGWTIPLSLFPSQWRVILEALPFKFFAYVPLQAYLGKLSPHDITNQLLLALLWIAVLAFASALAWKRGLKIYTAYGQ